ncbi:hypothetical protein QTP88_014849 [Uroleucon formosanum]
MKTTSATGRSRTYVPATLRRCIFDILHNQAHPGIKAILSLVKERHCWPDMDRQVRNWTKHCTVCQRTKVHRHIVSLIMPFSTPDRRFGHVHVDLVGPLPSADGCEFILTAIDRFTRWPEAYPLTNMSAHAVAEKMVSQWFLRFGVPDIVTTDQGIQFESELFTALSQTYGFQHIRTSPYHPQANGLVERLHRPLKAALTAHRNPLWTRSLPTVLLALRSIIKPDLGCSPAEMVYGTTLRLPGEFFHSVQPEPRAPDLIRALKESMLMIRPTPGTDHSRHAIFVPEQLSTAKHVFLRIDSTRKPLQPRYDGPFAVLERKDKIFKLQLHNRTSWISIDRLKPALLLCEDPIADHSYASTLADVKTRPKTRQKQVCFLFPRGRSDCQDGYGSAAILIYNSLRSSPVPIVEAIRKSFLHFKIDIVGSEVFLLNSFSFLTIWSCYIPSDSNIPAAVWDSLFSLVRRNSLLGGDFNAFHPAWGSHSLSRRVNIIYDSICSLGLCILNNGCLTHVGWLGFLDSAIDLSFCSPDLIWFLSWFVLDDPHDSDNFPISVSVTAGNHLRDTQSTNPFPNPIDESRCTFNLNKADWPSYSRLIQCSISSIPF